MTNKANGFLSESEVATHVPIFVLTAARSGSTLLRFILDSHPEICCPPELNLSQFCVEIQRSWTGMVDDSTREERLTLARAQIRATVSTLAAWHLARNDKRYFCDKSLTTVDQIDVVAEAFPDAKYIVVIRHCLDMVYSGLEASRWGFNAFGFMPYVGSTPNNLVAALVEYWCDRVERALDFERRFRDRTFRLYYEMLVREPDTTAKELFEFLGVAWEPEIFEKALSSQHVRGPADYEVEFLDKIGESSIGRGSSVPVGMILPPQRIRLNVLLQRLGYPPVTDDWNERSSPLLVNSTTSTLGSQPYEFDWLFDERVAGRASDVAGGSNESEKISLRVIVEDSPIRLSWIVDLWRGGVFKGEAAATCQVIITAETLLRAARGNWSPGESLHRGDLRIHIREEALSVEGVVKIFRKLFEPGLEGAS